MVSIDFKQLIIVIVKVDALIMPCPRRSEESQFIKAVGTIGANYSSIERPNDAVLTANNRLDWFPSGACYIFYRINFE